MNRSANAAQARTIDDAAAEAPTLSRMGVMRPQQISHYSLRQDGSSDTLRLHYKREKGSLLPVTRRYQFGRAVKTIVADGGTARMEDIHEISPHLLDAIDELDALLARQERDQAAQDAMTEPKVELLDELAALRKQVVRGADPATAGTLSVAFERIARQVEAL